MKQPQAICIMQTKVTMYHHSKIALSKGYNFGHTLQNVLKEDLDLRNAKGEIRIKKVYSEIH